MKKNKLMFITFLGPALLAYIIVYLYPVIRTTLMSFHKVANIVDDYSKWEFVGLKNFKFLLFESSTFLYSLKNIGFIFFWGVLGVMAVSLLFAIILNSGIRFKLLFRSIIYLPNIIASVAMGTMWIHYVMNNQYGLFKKIFTFLGLQKLAEFTWTEDSHLLLSMTIAYCFGTIGFYMLVYMAAMDKIPSDFYEAATLEGASVLTKFFKITLPLIRGIFKTTITLWALGSLGFFAWSMIFSPTGNLSVITPQMYLYKMCFQDSNTGETLTQTNAGTAAAVGIMITLLTLLMFTIVNLLIKDDDYEY